MNKRYLLTMLLMFSNFAICQVIPPDPLPDCPGIQRIGNQHDDGYLTENWVMAYDINNDGCDGVAIQVSGQMQAGDFAYAIVELDQFTQSTPEEIEFSINLTDIFQSLPIGESVKVVELLNPNSGKRAEVEFKNVLIPVAETAPLGQKDAFSTSEWLVKIRWFGAFVTVVSEDVFMFEKNEFIYFNYLWDDNDISAPVSLVSLGGDRISVSPYTDPNLSGIQTSDGSNPFKISLFNLGLINSSVLLLDGDRIEFDLNLIDAATPK